MGQPARPAGVVAEFFSGVGTLFRGFGFWGRRPGAMALGLIPAAIVFAVLLTLVILLAVNLDAITLWLTPFAAEWDEVWRGVLRVALGVALLVGVVVLFAVTFTGLTLAVGDPFYERIWKAVEAELGGVPDGPEAGFWRAVGDGLSLAVRGALTGLLALLIGLVPLVGSALAAVIGTVLSGRLLATELTVRPLERRGLDARQRRAVLRGRRARTLGFGVAVQLVFLIPLGAVIAMPAAVAGAVLLARESLGDPTPPTQRVE
jgi:CysZ protein